MFVCVCVCVCVCVVGKHVWALNELNVSRLLSAKVNLRGQKLFEIRKSALCKEMYFVSNTKK